LEFPALHRVFFLLPVRVQFEVDRAARSASQVGYERQIVSRKDVVEKSTTLLRL
jgi:hypothetical protein